MADTPEQYRPENQLANGNRDTLNISQPGEGSTNFNWDSVRKDREASGRKTVGPDPSVNLKDVGLSAASAPLELVRGGAEVFRAGNDFINNKAAQGAAENPNPLGMSDQMMQVMRQNQGNSVTNALNSGVQSVGAAAGRASDAIQSGYSEGAKQAAAMPFVDRDEQGNLRAGAGVFDKDAWIINTIPTVTQLLTTGAFAGLSATAARNAVEQTVYRKLAQTLPDDVARATARETAEKAAERAGKTAFVGANTVAAQGGAAVDMRNQINDIGFNDLMQSPTFQNAFAQIDSDPKNQQLSDSQKLSMARQQVADQAANAVTADPKMLAVNIAASTLGDHTLLNLITRKGATSGIIPGIATGAIAEGSTEFAQGATQRFVQNQQLNDAAAQNIDPLKGVVETGASNAVLGAGIGAAAGTVGGVRARRNGNDAEPTVTDTQPDTDSSPAPQPASADGAAESAPPVDQSPAGAPSSRTDDFRDTPAYLRGDPRIQGFAEDSEVQDALARGDSSPAADELIQQQMRGGDQGFTPEEISAQQEAERLQQERTPRLPAPGQTSTIALPGDAGVNPAADESQAGRAPEFTAGQPNESSRIQLMSSGKPFSTERSAQASRWAKEDGARVEPVDGGYAVRIPDNTPAYQKGQPQDDGVSVVGSEGLTVLHGSGNPDLNANSVEIIRATGQKQGKRGRVYGGFYNTHVEDAVQAERYAGMMGGDAAVYNVNIRPGTKVLRKSGDITRLTDTQINGYLDQGYGAIEGKDPRGQTEFVVIDKKAIADIAKRGEQRAEQNPVNARADDAAAVRGDQQERLPANEMAPESEPSSAADARAESRASDSVAAVDGSTDTNNSLTESQAVLDRARQAREQNPANSDGSNSSVRFSRSGARLNGGYRISEQSATPTAAEPQVRRGMSKTNVDAVARQFVRDLNGAAKVDVQVVASQQEAAALVPGGIPAEYGTVHAMYQPRDKRVVLVASNLASAADVRAKLRHEILAHHGMETIVGADQYQGIMRAISQTRGSNNPEIRKAWDTVRREYAGESPDTQAHEFLAHMAEVDTSTGLGAAWDRLVGRITSALRSVGLLRPNDISPSEIRNILRSIATSFRNDNTTPPRGTRQSDNLFSRTGQDEIAQATNRKMGFNPETGRTEKAKSFFEKIRSTDSEQRKSWLLKTGRALNTRTFDGLAPIKYAEDNQDGINAQNSAYIGARMAAGSGAVTSATMEYGLPKYNRAEGIVERMQGTGKEDSLIGILDSLGNKREDFLKWIAGNRSEQLMAEGRENLFTAEEIQYMKSLRNGNEELFDAVKKKYDAFTTAILDLQVDTGLLSKDARDQWADSWYIPYYRQVDEEKGEVSGPWSTKGVANQRSPAKKLKGGEANINDPIENLFNYTAKAIDASMKNEAMRRAVANLGDTDMMERIDSPNKFDFQAIGKDVIKVNIDGDENLVRIHDPELYRAFTMIDLQRSDAAFMKAARQAKRVLTIGTTSMPDFIVRNFMRDSLHSWAINKDGFKPVVASWQGLVKGMKKDETLIDMMFAGATFGGGYSNVYDPGGTARSIRSVLRKKGYNDSQIREFESSIVKTGRQAVDKIGSALDKYKHVSEAAENANRIATYEAAIKSGKSRAQAAFDSRDLMDFSMQGASKLVINLSDMLPFFNARLQGLSKLTRAIKEDPVEVTKRSAYIAGASLALLALNWDNDKYEELPDWDKDAYWHAFIGDQHIRIPKPFEIGLLFGTLPERLARNIGGRDSGAKTAKLMAMEFANTMAFTPIPQVALPIAETWVNYSFFTGNPIENMSDSNLVARARYDDRTSMLAREVGEATGMSPKQIDHVVQGYTGSLGGYILAASNFIIRRGGDYGSVPEARTDELPLIKSFIRGNAPAKSTHFQEDFYKMMTQASEVYSTVRDYRRQGRIEEANELAQENAGKLAARPVLNHTQTQIRRLNQQIEMIKSSKVLTPEQKREKIDRALDSRNKLVQMVVQRVNPRFDSERD